ncbi:hypothetical protein BSKO_13556 [Bryopsis sp. KO-2023]|nr:hypothetical protein BSKO_13556 [Bryopsis sp. KO-2023]
MSVLYRLKRACQAMVRASREKDAPLEGWGLYCRLVNTRSCSMGDSARAGRPPQTSAPGEIPEIPECIRLLGVSREQWRERCKVWGGGFDLGDVQENLELLEKWGLTSKGRKRVVLSSSAVLSDSKRALERKLEWLEEVLGLSRREVVKVVRTFPRYLQDSTYQRITNFLSDFSDENHYRDDVARMVVDTPKVLGLHRNFDELFGYCNRRFGYTKAQFMAGVMKHPPLLKCDIRGSIEPKLDYFEKELRLTTAQILSILVTHPETFEVPVKEDIQPQIDNFFRIGLDWESARRVIGGAPLLLFRDFEETVERKIMWLEDRLNFRRYTAIQALVKHPRIFPSSLHTWEGTCDFFLWAGMNKIELRHFMRRCPKFLAHKPESLKAKYKFAREVLQRDWREILRSNRFFSYSLEDRIMFRTALMARKGKDITRPSFRDVFDPSNVTFGSRFRPGEVEAFSQTWQTMSFGEKLHSIKANAYPGQWE